MESRVERGLGEEDWKNQWAWDGQKWILKSGLKAAKGDDPMEEAQERMSSRRLMAAKRFNPIAAGGLDPLDEHDEDAAPVHQGAEAPLTHDPKMSPDEDKFDLNAIDNKYEHYLAIMAIEFELKNIKFKLKIKMKNKISEPSGLHLLVGGQDHCIPVKRGKAKCKAEVPEGVHEAILVTEAGEVLGRWRVDARDEGAD